MGVDHPQLVALNDLSVSIMDRRPGRQSGSFHQVDRWESVALSPRVRLIVAGDGSKAKRSKRTPPNKKGDMLVLHQTSQLGQATLQSGIQSFAPSAQLLGQQGIGHQAQALQQFQQIILQLEQAESRHAQLLQQIQAEEQKAVQELQYLRQLSQQFIQQAPYPQAQYQTQPFTTFPTV